MIKAFVDVSDTSNFTAGVVVPIPTRLFVASTLRVDVSTVRSANVMPVEALSNFAAVTVPSPTSLIAV